MGIPQFWFHYLAASVFKAFDINFFRVSEKANAMVVSAIPSASFLVDGNGHPSLPTLP